MTKSCVNLYKNKINCVSKGSTCIKSIKHENCVNEPNGEKSSCIKGKALNNRAKLTLSNRDLAIHTQKFTPDMIKDQEILVSDINYFSLYNSLSLYKAGNISKYLKNWEILTSDKEIISIIKYGLTLNTAGYVEPKAPHQYKHSDLETMIINKEIQNFLKKGIIVFSTIEENDFFSPIFARTKKDGDSARIILNLKSFNKNITTEHFKMESIKNVKDMMTLGCWMASVDLKDAFYSIPVHNLYHKFLKFLWNKIAYHFVCMPNGYADAMRVHKNPKTCILIFTYVRILVSCICG